MFVFLFKNVNDDPKRNFFDKYYMPLVEIKDFSALIDNKPFFDQPVKTNKKCVLDYLYHQKYYKLIGIDLSRQTNISISQKINFVRKLEEDDGATMFLIAEKQKKTILNFSLDSLIVTDQYT